MRMMYAVSVVAMITTSNTSPFFAPGTRKRRSAIRDAAFPIASASSDSMRMRPICSPVSTMREPTSSTVATHVPMTMMSSDVQSATGSFRARSVVRRIRVTAPSGHVRAVCSVDPQTLHFRSRFAGSAGVTTAALMSPVTGSSVS